jgi:hypothetical protein
MGDSQVPSTAIPRSRAKETIPSTTLPVHLRVPDDPFFAHRSFPASNCGLIRAGPFPRFEEGEDGRKDQASGDERHVDDGEVQGLSIAPRHMADVRSFQQDDPAVLAELQANWPYPTSTA